MTPIEALNVQARMCPGNIAFISKRKIWTYDRLAQEASDRRVAVTWRGHLFGQGKVS